MISFIVSTYQRPLQLLCCLSSLIGQEDCESEIIVYDNSDSVDFRLENRSICAFMDSHFNPPFAPRYMDTHAESPQTCYHGLEVVPVGNWLCFPSDDSYYVPKFAKLMIGAAERWGLDFVYCDLVYDPRLACCTKDLPNEYSVMNQYPSPGSIDKTGFIVSREAFERVGGWPAHDADWRDGALAEKLVKSGVRHGKVNGPMVVHN